MSVQYATRGASGFSRLKQTKQKFIRLYYLDCWIQIIQSDEKIKNSTKCFIVQILYTVC